MALCTGTCWHMCSRDPSTQPARHRAAGRCREDVARLGTWQSWAVAQSSHRSHTADETAESRESALKIPGLEALGSHSN